MSGKMHWLLLFSVAYLAFITYAAPYNGTGTPPFANNTMVASEASSKYVWSCLGDSWASGVTYGLWGLTDYDNNADHCMRIKTAYSAQMSNDDSWIPQGRTQEFHFQACSGTRWRQIDAEPHLGHIQLNDVPDNVDMILLQVGGNNANFANIAYSCIFAPEGADWGPEYPDPAGRCAKEIENTATYIHGKWRNQLFQDARWIVNTIFDHPHVKKNPNFRLFFSGYFRFFYDEGGAGDWCDDVSFAVRRTDRPRLSLALRKKINELIVALNSAIEAGIRGSFHPERATFIDVDEHIDEHRFCQPGHNLRDQYFGNKVFLWNMSPNGILWNSGSGNGAADGKNDTVIVLEPTEAEVDHWLEHGTFTEDPREIPWNMTAAVQVARQGKDAFTASDPSNIQWLDMIGPYQQNLPGLVLRPFHPTTDGYTSMARTLMTRIKATLDSDALPVIAPPSFKEKPKHSLQIILFSLEGLRWWRLFQGPQGVAVSACNPTDSRFKILDEKATRDMFQNSANPAHPPRVAVGKTWYIDIEGESDCRFESSADGPGSLKCGDYMDFPFKADPQWNDGTMNCDHDIKWHRAWYVEY
ncbi:hypothetical protein CFE70_007454 [Pyrenophora teres f. teres 0-1]|uniref:SGNH hydrolase-type esterase domain-containing protein n=1 Tax=Pyrenophora teres f. teres (strain 0-1) TaxID=861557 RepID=E3RHG4_PYRTT|nr:hypothetical protein PTT_07351 [Pyrenophora teres f. teres 0-1]KAE8843864.1 hypothetical protein HRS9122_04967 [Pyrenophora teres f. teres]